MKIALAQLNPVVGDMAGNAKRIAEALDQARAQQARLVIFPEMVIIGYPPRDLLLKPAAVEQCVEAVGRLAERCTDLAAIIGYPCPSDKPVGRILYNAAAFCAQGRILYRQVKSLLPTYDVFDERRYFEPPHAHEAHRPVSFQGLTLGISICEDLWTAHLFNGQRMYEQDPIPPLIEAGAQVLVNCSASPYVLDKHAYRVKLLSDAARRYRLPIIYCNQVGGNDELVFDGNSCVVDAQGRLIAQARDFQEDLLIVELELPEPRPAAAGESSANPAAPSPVSFQAGRIETSKTGLESAYHALVLGLRDYCRKCGFHSAVVGLSGGIDSALTCALAVAALGAENVRGVAMPSRFSSGHSLDDARELARRLGIQFHVVPIGPVHESFEQLLQPHFQGQPPDTTEENIQARIRGVILMAFSNKFGSLLVTTGNKSELAVGYCTLYGDMAGGLAVLSDVPKTLVWELARWINEHPDSPLRRQFDGPVIPSSSITKVPSAELRPNQTDQDSLPPYPVLDQIIERYVEREKSARQIIAETQLDPATVLRMVRLIDRNEYKRKQAAPGLKITSRAFGVGRRMPMAQRFDNGPIAP